MVVRPRVIEAELLGASPRATRHRPRELRQDHDSETHARAQAAGADGGHRTRVGVTVVAVTSVCRSMMSRPRLFTVAEYCFRPVPSTG